jgi:hypothetical protein
MTDTAKLREALAKMTPGEWEYGHKKGGERPDGGDWGAVGLWSPTGMILGSGGGWDWEFEEPGEADAAGIVLLRNSASGLLDEVDRLRAQWTALRVYLNDLNDVVDCGDSIGPNAYMEVGLEMDRIEWGLT